MKNLLTKNSKQTRKLMLSICIAVVLTAGSSGCNGPAIKLNLRPAGAVSSEQLMSEATGIIQQALADEDPIIRMHAIEVVADTRQTLLMPKVQRLLSDKIAPVRFAAAVAVGDMQYALVKDSIKQMLNDTNENIRIAAAYALSRIGSPEHLEIIRKATASKDLTVRANAVMLLGKSGDKNSFKFLYWALRNRDSGNMVKFNAVEAIARLGDERIYPKLWSMLISVYADDRVIGIKAMGALGTLKAKDSLITMLDDDVLVVRLAAAEQLGALGSTTGEHQVLSVFRKKLPPGLDQEDIERIKISAALAIGEVGTDALIRYLPELLKEESKFIRIAAAKAVFRSLSER